MRPARSHRTWVSGPRQSRPRVRQDAASITPAFSQDMGAAAARQVVTPESPLQGDSPVAATITRSAVGRVQTLAANQEGGTAVVQLYPPELGRLRLSVHVDGSQSR